LSPFTHEARRLSDGHVDGVAWAWRRADAIDANFNFGKRSEKTLSQHQSSGGAKLASQRCGRLWKSHQQSRYVKNAGINMT